MGKLASAYRRSFADSAASALYRHRQILDFRFGLDFFHHLPPFFDLDFSRELGVNNPQEAGWSYHGCLKKNVFVFKHFSDA